MTRPPLRRGQPIAGAAVESINAELLTRTSDASASSLPVRAARIEARRAVGLLLVAVVLGGILRFGGLGSREMSVDEGASWAAASASSIRYVLQLQPRLNPGKFAVHDIALHVWIGVFGAGLATMRALSALAGTLAIAAVFVLARELFSLNDAMRRSGKEQSVVAPSYALLGAIVALLFAVNLVFIKYAQEVRMYSVALLCALLQVEYFLRSLRRPAPARLVLAALFTALAIASTFTMVLILVPESLWLVYLARFRENPICPHLKPVVWTLIGGLALLIAPAIMYLHARLHAPALLTYAWAPLPPFWAPLSMFNKATGSLAFPVLLGLALWGVIRGWHQERDVVVFMLLWMLAPPIAVLAASYVARPAFVERYMLASFVPFFLLAALGIRRVRGFPAQCILLALVTLLSLGHDYSYWRSPHDVQWREAVRAATGTTGPTVAVAPPYAADVVRYYLRESRKNWSVETGQAQAATVAIVADSGVSGADAARIAAACPRLLISLRGVIVREH
jgi:mannosyltransferase